MKELKTTLDYARWYVSKGFSVIPLRPKDKTPAIDSWKVFQEHKPTEDNLKIWFGNGNQNNIGIVTGRISNITVVDLDSEAAVKYARDHNFPETPLAKTGKGYHLFYQYKEGSRNFQKRDDLPEIDLRSEGGYVVAPPSIHPTGEQYQWVKGKELDDLPLAELPEIILAQKPEHRTALKELYQGVSEGSRNDSLARLAGSWVNDGLTFAECLENAHLWNSKNNPTLHDKEITQTVKSIFAKHHRESLTQGIPKGLPLTALADLLKEPDESVRWLVEGLLLSGGFSIIAAKPKVGKSTFARSLALYIARGEDFFGRQVQEGPVIYLALEDKRSEVKRHFKDMGATGEEPIFIFSGRVPGDAITQVTKAVEDVKPVLLIIDPLFRFAKVKDIKDYAETTAKLEPLLMLARESGVHVACLHHNTKAEGSGGDGLLGSIGIFGSVDTLISLKRSKEYRTIESFQRNGDDLPETVLAFDRDTRTISLAESKEETDIQRMKENLIDYFFGKNGEPITEAIIDNEVEGRRGIRKKALRSLYAEGKVKRDGQGTKGSPFKYILVSWSPDIHAEPENQNQNNGREWLKDAVISDSRKNDTCSPIERNWEPENKNGSFPSCAEGCLLTPGQRSLCERVKPCPKI